MDAQSTTKDSADAGRRLALGLLALAAVAVAVRGVHLLGSGGADLNHALIADTQAGTADEVSQAPLTAQDYALLSMACPSAVDAFPGEWTAALPEPQPVQLPPPYRPMAKRESAEPKQSPKARITGVRVASRPMRVAQRPGGLAPGAWLVAPDQWFVPEDRSKAAEPAAAAPEPPPSDQPAPESAEPASPADSGPAAPKPAAPEPVEPERAVAAPTEESSETTKRAEEENNVQDDTFEPGPWITAPGYETPDEKSPEVTPPESGQAETEQPADPVVVPPPAEALPTADPPTDPPADELPAPPRDGAEAGGETIVPRSREPVAPLFAPPGARGDAPGAVPHTPGAGTPRLAPVEPAPSRKPLFQSPHSTPAKKLTPAEQAEADKAHAELFDANCYPSARDCAKCHKKQYEEWRVSSHAYAFVSPMFHKFEQKITDVSQGTVGYFCMRCHSPAAVAMCIPRDTPLWDMPQVAREGVTCIACHRVNERYSKTNGERRIVPGDIYAPVYGGKGGDGVAAVVADKAKYKVKTSPDEKGAGQPIHTEGRFFEQLSKAEFCTSCHQVAVHPGIKLEVVSEQYRASPACKKGVTCQQCHMGAVPGIASPYEIGSIADVGGKSVNDHRTHANHTFYGPGYSIAHPGVFPHNADADRWTIPEWLAFDWRAGWGTDDFEDALAKSQENGGRIHCEFPKVWQEADDRYDAREIIDDNLKKLADKRELRRQVMENGARVTGPHFRKAARCGEDLKFEYLVTNLNEGHNLPTASLGAQPQLWANVVLIGPDGRRLWETGYLDSYGDLADIHSEDVRHGRLPFDSQLFNLQTMFLITGATGTDREFFLPVNVSVDQVPHLRPGNLPITVLNHPPLIRMESRSIAPLGSKRVKYRVPGELLTQRGTYRLSFRMRSRTEPIYFMRFCESTVEMQRSMNEGILDIHPYSVEFFVE